MVYHFLRLFLSLFLIGYIHVSYAWNDIGHMLVAQIAYEKLNSDARKNVDDLIITFKQSYPNVDNFSQMAVWPDAIKAHRIDMFTHWHYVNIPFSLDNTPINFSQEKYNAVWATSKLEIMVGSRYVHPVERARFLAFLIHIVGDLHHPLHTSEYFSAAHPHGDEGGNSYFISSVQKREKLISLHKFWDSGLGLLRMDLTPEEVTILKNKITESYPERYFGQDAENLLLTDWTNEGLSLAKSFVYTIPETQLPSNAYIEHGKHIVEKRIALAGYRLANLLNILLAENNDFEKNKLIPVKKLI